MTVRYDLAGLIAGIEESEGGTEFVICEAADKAQAVSALRLGRNRAFAVRHPEEPDEAYLPFASGVYETDDGAAFWADTKDVSAYPEVAAALGAAVAAGAAESTCDGTLIARRKLPQQSHTAAVLPGWFPMPPEFVREDEQPIVGVGRTVFFKCWTLFSPDELLAFYRDALEPAGFALEVERKEGTREWFRFGVSHALFTRADGTIKVETQTLEPHSDASERDRDLWQHESPYATYTETWIRLDGLADQQEMEWVGMRWVPVSEP